MSSYQRNEPPFRKLGNLSMSWLTVLWSMSASVALTFALLHMFIWAKGIRPRANLSFALAAIAAAVFAGMELMIMQSASIEKMAMLLRWVRLPALILWLGIVGFVRFYFHAGRLWLAWTGLGLRVLSFILNFTTGQNLFFKEITSLRQVTILGGETIFLPVGQINPWYVFGPLSLLTLAAFVLDAAITLWRRGSPVDRRRAILFSTSIIFFLLATVVHSVLINIGAIDWPYMVSFSFMPILLAMSYELSCELLYSAQITEQLRASEAELSINKQRIKLAMEAANLRIWDWDIMRDEVWNMGRNSTLYGLDVSQKVSSSDMLGLIYEEDRERVLLAAKQAMAGNGKYESEYRVKMPDGEFCWFSSRGCVEFNDSKQPVRISGVTIDITRRKQAELEAQQHRNELTHLSRVTLLGELSGSLAHELNQPLAAILSNAQAAQRFLASDLADLDEVRTILNDIVAENRRAGDIIQRLRLLLKKGDIQHAPLDPNKLVSDVLQLLNGDLSNHNIRVHIDLAPSLPVVIGDRIQLQQVLLNLIMNASEAMFLAGKKNCRLIIRAAQRGDHHVQLSVVDQGPGIPPENLDNIFKPFFSTKSHGMGLGLTICRTIIAAHGGQLWGTNTPPAGATFYFTLPIHVQETA